MDGTTKKASQIAHPSYKERKTHPSHKVIKTPMDGNRLHLPKNPATFRFRVLVSDRGKVGACTVLYEVQHESDAFGNQHLLLIASKRRMDWDYPNSFSDIGRVAKRKTLILVDCILDQVIDVLRMVAIRIQEYCKLFAVARLLRISLVYLEYR